MFIMSDVRPSLLFARQAVHSLNPQKNDCHTKITMPIHIFDVKEQGIDKSQFAKELMPLFEHLPPDNYLVRKEQIDFLTCHRKDFAIDEKVLAYYLGQSSFASIAESYSRLAENEKFSFNAIIPNRFRSAGTFTVLLEKEKWVVKRLPMEPFSQTEALISDKKSFDFRTLPRKFAELPNDMEKIPSFRFLLIGVAKKIKRFFPSIHGIQTVIHATHLVSTKNRPADNSPEGVHQDGYPVIIQAVVVSREGISGGENIIFAEDKKTALFTTTLQNGMGLMQPDLGSPFWHKITPMTFDNSENPELTQGHRSTLGFDIQILE